MLHHPEYFSVVFCSSLKSPFTPQRQAQNNRKTPRQPIYELQHNDNLEPKYRERFPKAGWKLIYTGSASWGRCFCIHSRTDATATFST